MRQRVPFARRVVGAGNRVIARLLGFLPALFERIGACDGRFDFGGSGVRVVEGRRQQGFELRLRVGQLGDRRPLAGQLLGELVPGPAQFLVACFFGGREPPVRLVVRPLQRRFRGLFRLGQRRLRQFHLAAKRLERGALRFERGLRLLKVLLIRAAGVSFGLEGRARFVELLLKRGVGRPRTVEIPMQRRGGCPCCVDRASRFCTRRLDLRLAVGLRPEDRAARGGLGLVHRDARQVGDQRFERVAFIGARERILEGGQPRVEIGAQSIQLRPRALGEVVSQRVRRWARSGRRKGNSVHAVAWQQVGFRPH